MDFYVTKNALTGMLCPFLFHVSQEQNQQKWRYNTCNCNKFELFLLSIYCYLAFSYCTPANIFRGHWPGTWDATVTIICVPAKGIVPTIRLAVIFVSL